MQSTQWNGQKLIKAKSKYKSNCNECQELIEINDNYYFNPDGERFKNRIFCEDCGDQLVGLQSPTDRLCDKCNGLIKVGEQCFYAFYTEPRKRIVCSECNYSAKKQSVEDLSSPTTACGNDDCEILIPTNQFLCRLCNSKLPKELQKSLQDAYNKKLRNKNNQTLKELADQFRKALPFLEKPKTLMNALDEAGLLED